MGILHIIHNICPAFKTDNKKYCHPRKANIIEGNSTLEWIIALAFTFSIIVIPINAGGVVDECNVAIWDSSAIAHDVSYKMVLNSCNSSLYNSFLLRDIPFHHHHHHVQSALT